MSGKNTNRWLPIIGNVARVLLNALSSGGGQQTRPRSGGGKKQRARLRSAPRPGAASGNIPKPGPASGVGTVISDDTATPGQAGPTATVELSPHGVNNLVITYAPQKDGTPDAGEVIWTWVPYAENDGRGKDRPVLVIARHTEDRVYVVKLTSQPHDGDRDFLPIGSGAWDSQGRESWVDVDQLYSVHHDGMRREAAVLDRARFNDVAELLERRFGWRRG
ncbi:type II toxin-antitoxin system PemK/MazF family toxin [Microbacterium sp. YY-01]|uniref:type II toxin-antitoxin system PemK/MazF family toxin n=1 Tax=Microbacterium sp. YY-01 TaxID=3421634 RepID=UPI003D17039F